MDSLGVALAFEVVAEFRVGVGWQAGHNFTEVPVGLAQAGEVPGRVRLVV
jgi:hypothetical protein